MALPLALQCPSCSSPLQKEAFNEDQGFVKCSYCGALMTLPTSSRSNLPAFRERPPVPLPSGMNLEKGVHGIVLTRRWFTAVVLFLIPFCLLWNGILVGWYVMAFQANTPILFKLFPLIHVAVGVGLTYFTLATLINKTRITVDRGEVTITHGPLPWFGYKKVPGLLIDQIFAKSHVSHGKNGPVVDYQVWLHRSDGRQEKFISSQLTADQALFLEQQLEMALGIEDRAMPGELPR